mmetsp:Transcript_30001/g.89179  ORF Transcript_30001/g.89179 Transcript_30001/m.89179 type:complete len:262 (+) Transcript_30001:56-841(+)
MPVTSPPLKFTVASNYKTSNKTSSTRCARSRWSPRLTLVPPRAGLTGSSGHSSAPSPSASWTLCTLAHRPHHITSPTLLIMRRSTARASHAARSAAVASVPTVASPMRMSLSFGTCGSIPAIASAPPSPTGLESSTSISRLWAQPVESVSAIVATSAGPQPCPANTRRAHTPIRAVKPSRYSFATRGLSSLPLVKERVASSASKRAGEIGGSRRSWPPRRSDAQHSASPVSTPDMSAPCVSCRSMTKSGHLFPMDAHDDSQ